MVYARGVVEPMSMTEEGCVSPSAVQRVVPGRLKASKRLITWGMGTRVLGFHFCGNYANRRTKNLFGGPLMLFEFAVGNFRSINARQSLTQLAQLRVGLDDFLTERVRDIKGLAARNWPKARVVPTYPLF
jgi:hypothetical protein